MIPRQFGHYQLEALLGVGGMGEVYRAHDTLRGRRVALKLLPEIFSNDQEYLSRFRREQHVAARLREPHVIPIHDFGEIDNRLYIDMRLVDGEDIGHLLEKNGPLAPARAVHLIEQIAEALTAAHADGLVHRDIKPSNVLVTASDFVYVVDFGIARAIGATRTSLTMTGATVGTLDYMAPERFTHLPIDCRADVYSLACVLHECLTASRPFPGDDLPSLMYAHLYTAPPQPSSVLAGLPPALDAVISRGMAKLPDDRYPSAAELATAAREALTAEAPAPVSAPVSRAPETVVGPVPTAAGSSAGTEDKVGAGRRAPAPAVAVGAVGAVGLASQDGGHRSVDRLPSPVLAGKGRPVPPGLPPPPGAPPTPAGGSRRRGRRGLLLALVVLVVAGLVAVTFRVVRSPDEGGGTAAGEGASTSSSAGSVTKSAETAPPAPPVVAASIAVPTVAGTVAVGATPGFIQVAPNGRFAYIANRGAGVVTVLDTAINQVTATIPIPQGPPQFVSFSPSGKQAYVSIFDVDRDVHLVSFLDTATNKVTDTIEVGRRPFASATTRDGALLFVPSHDDGRVDVIDIASAEVIQEVPVAANPHWVAFGADGRFAYTANHESGVVTVLESATRAVVTTVDVGVSPHSTTVSPDGTRLAVVNFDSNEVSIIDTATHTVVATVPVGLKPQDIDYAPDGRFFYVANVDGDSISVVDTETNQVTATIPTDSPTSVSVRPDGKQAYVTNLNAGTVLILDIAAE